MILSTLVLFSITFLAGLPIIHTRKGWSGEKLKLTLIFAGAYLFSITITHILPELYTQAGESAIKVGVFVLIGFFVQQFLEYLTSGVEHGHMHEQSGNHQHGSFSSLFVVTGLCLHSFLEGTLLAHPSSMHAHNDATGLLVGIVIHKIPAAIALMSVVMCHIKSKITAYTYLLIFSISSPLGLILSDYAAQQGFFSPEMIVMLFGIVSGSFLYISTTIFFETSPGHHFNFKKVAISLLGAFSAIFIDYLF
ncbi:MAG: ZIP family metal transporter [Cyclobacteriaceae bacterium]|nr:ZIP family metal transporter [Cyclobacteriaceae bacterium]